MPTHIFKGTVSGVQRPQPLDINSRHPSVEVGVLVVTLETETRSTESWKGWSETWDPSVEGRGFGRSFCQYHVPTLSVLRPSPLRSSPSQVVTPPPPSHFSSRTLRSLGVSVQGLRLRPGVRRSTQSYKVSPSRTENRGHTVAPPLTCRDSVRISRVSRGVDVGWDWSGYLRCFP